jgi:hypothetical protein
MLVRLQTYGLPIIFSHCEGHKKMGGNMRQGAFITWTLVVDTLHV